MTNIVTKSVELIYQMDNNQLNEVIEAIKLKRNHLARQAVRSFVVGDMVQFTSRRTGGKVNALLKKSTKNILLYPHTSVERNGECQQLILLS